VGYWLLWEAAWHWNGAEAERRGGKINKKFSGAKGRKRVGKINK
jgi:hypothetical protein